MAAAASAVAGPSSYSPRQQPPTPTISSSAVSPRRSSRNFKNASSSPPATPPPNRRHSRRKNRENDRNKRPLRPYASEDAIDKRHSHGLSWSSVTRDSVVDNLLFSLDNLSRKDVTGEDDLPNPFNFDRAKYAFPNAPSNPFPPTRTARRARAHTHSSSLSTDYDLSAMPESPPQMSVSAKHRRSNSSSKYRPSSTINSRFSISKPSMEGRPSVDTQKPAAMITTGSITGTARESIERGRLDFNYDMLMDKNKPRWKRRSMSVDHIFADSVVSPSASILDRGRPIPSVHSKYDAGYEVAPEPMIAGGPRRLENPSATGPVYVNQAQQKLGLRKITTQSDLRSANAQGQLSPSIPPEVRNQASNFVRMSGMQSRPTTQGGRSSALQSPALTGPKHPPPPPPTPKDKTSFFRRMFGGSSSRNASTQIPRSHTPENNGPAASGRVSTSAGAQTRTGTRQSGDGDAVYPALTKRPSSLFRRRKKSLSEAPPPPPVPSLFLNVAAAEPSPLGESLSKALDPYLMDATNAQVGQTVQPSRPSTRGSVAEDSDNPDIFHSGYTQRPEVSLGSRDMSTWQTSPKNTQPAGEDDNSTAKLKVKKRKPELLAPVNTKTSFLLDSSSKELSETPVETPDRISTPAPDPTSKDRGLSSPASKTSIGNGTLISGKRSVETGMDARKPSVVSTVGSDKGDTLRTRPSTQGSRKSDGLPLHPSVEELLFSEQSVLSALPTSVLKSDSAGSPGLQSATSGTYPHDVHSPHSPQSQYHSASSLPLPSVQRDGDELRISSDLVDDGAEYRERARRIFDGDEEDVAKSQAASWLGERNTLSTRTLSAYLQLFDLTGVNILTALRLLCGRLTLRGETQQFDRIITTMSARWCECNPNHGFKAQDVVHTICYSLILLNTDLHLADIEGKMSRSAYVKNTLPTIRRVVADAAPNAFDDTVRPTPLPSRPTLPWTTSNGSLPPSPGTPSNPAGERASLEQDRQGLQKHLSVRPAVSRQDSDTADASTSADAASNALVNQTWTGSMRTWESEIESILKSFFVAIKIEPLPLHGAPAVEAVAADRSLSAANLGIMRRTNSVISKSPSDTTSFRSKPGGLRSIAGGFQTKHSLARSKLYPSSTLSSSKTSFDDGNSVFSPTQSSWSKYSFSKTLTSASMQSLGQNFAPASDIKHSIGFANALSQAIIREENAGTDNDSVSMSVAGGLLDEVLTLEGAPWAKEGLVKHKHHLETPGKKARERNWTECFAVISKGKLTLFAFNTSSKSASMGRKTFTKGFAGARAAGGEAPTVGGGDWMENAEQLDFFILRQTIATTLPPPGYSSTRPHVWALSLPTGAVHLFQVGTSSIAQEFMSTANYWSARLSKEPLAGGVSNVEYGWSDQVINSALVDRPNSPPVNAPPRSIQSRQGGHKHSTSVGTLSKQSMTSSLRTSLDNGFGAKPRLPGDKVHLADWQPPTQSMMASQLMEVDQLKGLTAYVAHVEAELAKHNELKGAIELAFSPRHANYSRAMANWQRKSDYLLRENVKFQTYVDSLTTAQVAREQFYTKKNAAENVEETAGTEHRAELDAAAQ